MNMTTQHTSLGSSESKIVLAIETMLYGIRAYPASAWADGPLSESIQILLAGFKKELLKLCTVYHAGWNADHLEIIWDALGDKVPFRPGEALMYSAVECLSDEEMRSICAEISACLDAEWYDGMIVSKQQRTEAVRQQLEAFVLQMLNRHVRTTLIQIDLEIAQPFQDVMGNEEFCQCWDTLEDWIQTEQAAEGLGGYVWSIEQSLERGYHLHLAFFYDGDLCRNSRFKAQQIIDMWRGFTFGMGTGQMVQHPESASLVRDGRPLLDLIPWNDRHEAERCIRMLSHLPVGQTEEYLRMKPHCRETFGVVTLEQAI